MFNLLLDLIQQQILKEEITKSQGSIEVKLSKKKKKTNLITFHFFTIMSV